MQLSLFLLPAAVLLIRTTGGQQTAGILLALAAHESGHLLAAKMLGIPAGQMRVAPFGAQILLRGQPQPLQEGIIAGAGPLASLMAATLCAGILYFCGSQALLESGLRFSLMLAAVNLLPAPPLDGGRMLRAAAGGLWGIKTARRVCFALGIGLAAALLTLGVLLLAQGSNNPTLLLMGVFVVSGTFAERRSSLEAAALCAARRGRALRGKRAVPLKILALREDMPAREALGRLGQSSLIAVMDDSMGLLGTIGEGDLLKGMERRGSEVPLKDLV